MGILSTVNALTPAQAMWGKHLFMPPGQKYDIVSSGSWDGNINYKSEIDATQQATTEAQEPINKKGDDKQKSFSINIVVNKLASGLDPLTVHKSLCKSLGKKSYFFIGGVPIDKSYYFLQSVELRYSNIDIAPDGTPYRAEISLAFVEDIIMRVQQQKAKETTDKKTGKQTASKVGASKAAKEEEIKKWQKNLLG
jgi:hypothetical protein